MLPPQRPPRLFSAPGFLGAFCWSLVVLLGSCDRQSSTPEWDAPAEPPPAAARAEPAGPKPKAPAPVAVSGEGLRFVAYNVENWLTMDRYVEGKTLRGAPKPEDAKEAVVTLLVRHQPDVIGLSEIGTTEDLEEIRRRLAEAGLGFAHSHHSGGSDSVRHLGLLSRFPIVSTDSPAETGYRLSGRNFAIQRGVLDATIDADGKPYRFLGVHLKSKREIENGDQEAMRRAEARLLRRHVDSILDKDPGARLVVYGDFNDTRPSPSFRTVTGRYNDPTYLTAIPAKDSRGHAWTYHWSHHDIYSRIDFVTVSPALKPHVEFRRSYIIDDPEWEVASDHRPILAIFN